MKTKNINKLPLDQRKKLQGFIDSDGLEITRKWLGISRHTLDRAAGGLTIQRGTVALLEKVLSLGRGC